MKEAKVLICLDFDGVLVDSAGETCQSGWKAGQILWPEMVVVNENPDDSIIPRFCQIRPCLETGWESVLLIRLLQNPSLLGGDPISEEDILQNFQSDYKAKLLEQLSVTPDQCNEAFKQARNDWIAQNDGQDWIQAHDFYEGACLAVRDYLTKHGPDRLYIITTKAKEFALRLLTQQGLYCKTATKGEDENGASSRRQEEFLLKDHVYGLGSGPKAQVLAQILEQQNEDEKNTVAVMVEDNLETLFKIVNHEALQGKVLPTLASWGYNTPVQQQMAAMKHFEVLMEDDSKSIQRVLDPESVTELLEEFNKLTERGIGQPCR